MDNGARKGTTRRDLGHCLSRSRADNSAMGEGLYLVIRTLEDGERVSVARCQALDEAQMVVARLTEHWPGDYSIEPVPEGE